MQPKANQFINFHPQISSFRVLSSPQDQELCQLQATEQNKGTQIQPFIHKSSINGQITEQVSTTMTSYKSPLTGSNFKIFKRCKDTDCNTQIQEELTFPSTRDTNHSPYLNQYQIILQKNDNNEGQIDKQSKLCSSENNGYLVSSFRDFQQENNQLDFKCQGCEQYLNKITNFRKQNTKLEFQKNKLEEQIVLLKKDKQQLINRIQRGLLNYQINQQKIQGTNDRSLQSQTYINKDVYTLENIQVKDDYEAQLHEQKFLNNLLMLQIARLSNPDDSSEIRLSSESTINHERFQKISLQNFKLQAQVMTLRKMLSNQQFLPIFHYNTRIQKLRNAVVYWYQVSMKECKKLKKELIQLKNSHQNQKINLITNIKKQIQNYVLKNKQKHTKKITHCQYDDSISNLSRKTPIEIQQNTINNKFSTQKNNFHITRYVPRYSNISNVQEQNSRGLSNQSKKSKYSIINSTSNKKSSKPQSVNRSQIQNNQNKSSIRSSKTYMQLQKQNKNKKNKFCSKANCDANSINQYIQSTVTKSRKQQNTKKYIKN